MVLKTMVQAKMGSTERIVFTCSTWGTVHTLHGLSLVLDSSWDLMHALSKNLCNLCTFSILLNNSILTKLSKPCLI